MSRFLKLKDNSQVRGKLQFVSCNNFARGSELTTAEMRMFDVLSFESNSYFGERNAFTSQVGYGNGSVPDLDGSQLKLQLRRRITGKRQLNDTDVATNRIEPTNPATRSDQGAHVGDIPTCSQPSCVAAEPISDSDARVTPPDCQRQRLTAQSGSDTDDLPDAADVALNSLGDEQFRQAPRVPGSRLRAKTSLHSTSGLTKRTTIIRDHDCPTPERTFSDRGSQTPNMNSGIEDSPPIDDSRLGALRLHVRRYKNCIGAKTFLEDLPVVLREWVSPSSHSETAAKRVLDSCE